MKRGKEIYEKDKEAGECPEHDGIRQYEELRAKSDVLNTLFKTRLARKGRVVENMMKCVNT